MSKTCPACGKNASGRFCSHCGSPLDKKVACAECGNELPPGARFCNHCGAPRSDAAAPPAAAAEPAGSARRLPWVIVGVAALVLAGFFLVDQLGQETTPAAEQPMAAAAGGPSSIDIGSMSPREAADRLFGRVMSLVEAGDTAQARVFLPMALSAYQRVSPLDADARYHLGTLQLFAGAPEAARAQADTILATDPDHLFGLYTAAQAERALGQEDAARARYRRFLEVADAEIARQRPEYQAHEPALRIMRAEAERRAEG